jgi:hypothetical protein
MVVSSGKTLLGRRSHDLRHAVVWQLWRQVFPMMRIRLYDTAGAVIETHEHKGDFKEG